MGWWMMGVFEIGREVEECNGLVMVIRVKMVIFFLIFEEWGGDVEGGDDGGGGGGDFCNILVCK